MKPYSLPEFNQIIIYFDQSITSDKYSLLRFIIIIIYYYYSAITSTKNNKGYPREIPWRDHILLGVIRNEERI
ncbi:MAG TPA: hypothetical protein VLA74_08975 [Nitrososphaeraceae archaeon]|nr:hypothetical protein [Nitrososphaeraceae archaeon]